MDLVERIIQRAVRKSKDGRIGVADFLNEAASSLRYGVFTPMEANIIWHFASRGADGNVASERLPLNAFQSLLDAKWQAPLDVAPQEAVQSRGILHEIGNSSWNFVMGGIAGGIGAFTVYPIDLVKTRYV